MPRPNRSPPLHKALRPALFDATTLVARTDFADAGEGILAARTVAALLDLLDSHAEHEDTFVIPELGRHAPALAVSLQGDHGRLEGLQAELRALLPGAWPEATPGGE